MSFQSLLVPVDFSTGSIQALRLAVRIAKESGGRVTLLHVGLAPELYYGDLAAYGFMVPETTARVREQVATEQRKALEEVGRREVPPELTGGVRLREGYAPDEILAEAASGGYDCLVMGTHGRRGLAHALLGSVTERVLRKASVPVLVTR